MVLYTDIYGAKHMISRTWYFTPGTSTITMPAKAAYLRCSMVGAGGSASSGKPGGGAAFARALFTTSAGEQFTVQVGDTLHSIDAGTGAGDSILTKVVGSVVKVKAQRGGADGSDNGVKGLASASVGDTTRDGSFSTVFSGPVGPSRAGGGSGGDLIDTMSLGFGGSGATPTIGAGRGGGAAFVRMYESSDGSYVVDVPFQSGDGLVCVEVFDQNPTIQWPGYGG